MKIKNIIIGLGLILSVEIIFSSYTFARRTRDAKGSFDISVIDKSLHELGYSQSLLLTFQLMKVFPNLQYNLQKLSQVENPREKASHLAMFIKIFVDPTTEENQFELSDVLNKKTANCFGFAQLVYVLGKAAGLDVGLLPIPNIGPGHMANLIHTNKGDMILDLTNNKYEIGFYLSPIINWGENYENLNEEWNIWHLKDESKIDSLYSTAQIINEKGFKAELLASRGYEKGKIGSVEEELHLYEEAERLNPNSCVILNGLAVVYFKSGRLEESCAYFSRAVTINPYYTSAFFNLGCVKDALGYPKEAIDAYSKAIDIDPDYDAAWHNRGLVKLQLGIDASEDNEEKASELFKQALKDFDQAIKLDPDYAAAYDNRGNIHAIYGRNDKALDDFDTSIRLKPDVNAYLHRGLFKIYNLKQADEGLKDIRKALEINPNIILPDDIREML